MIVLTITLGARSLSGETLVPTSWQTSLFGIEEGPETLTLTDGVALPLRIGSSIEVHRFTLEAGFPYSLRYLTFEVEMQDLSVSDVTDWKVYAIYNGVIDYQSKVAQGEYFQDGLLKLRFYSDRSRAYLGEGTQEFALVTNLERAGDNPHLSLKQANSEAVSDFYKWAWMEGHFNQPWSELNVSQ